MTNTHTPVVVLGAGPAGLGASYRLAQRGKFDVTVVERNEKLGGNAGSFDIAGMRVDYGSHRLHPSCDKAILSDIRRMLGDDLLDRPRHGRIRLHGRWVHFPLKMADLVLNLPPSFIAGVTLDSLTKFTRRGSAVTFADALQRGLGRTICRDFYFPYARKIWGVDPAEIDAEQARRRVSAGTVSKLVRKVLRAGSARGRSRPGVGFFYPRSGFGAISEAFAAASCELGVSVRMRTSVTAIQLDSGRVSAVRTRSDAGEESLPARVVLSTVPVTQLARMIDPALPDFALKAACGLRFRSMILVYIVLQTEQFTEYDAHYFPEAVVPITRLSEPKNYGLATLPGKTVLCGEIPCAIGDSLWKADDSQLGRIMLDALEKANLPVRVPVDQIRVKRLPQAYPVYLRGYRADFDVLDSHLAGIEGLISFGRQGLFAHDNTHHALAMAYALESCLNDDGDLDHLKWQDCRRKFETHVVED